jgi:tRNA U34 2-thiouridine synthase MnmA/TrmU
VARKDAAANAVYVSRAYYSADKRRDAFLAGQLNWLAPGPPSLHGPLQCKVRHGPRAYACAAAPEPGGRLRVTLQGDDQGLAAGQVAVFYRDGLCLGSATILEALDAPPRPAPSAACAPDAAPLPVSA